jgi:hypothetical protein
VSTGTHHQWCYTTTTSLRESCTALRLLIAQFPEQVPERTERNLQAVGQEAGTEEPMEEGAKCEVLETEATPVS